MISIWKAVKPRNGDKTLQHYVTCFSTKVENCITSGILLYMYGEWKKIWTSIPYMNVVAFRPYPQASIFLPLFPVLHRHLRCLIAWKYYWVNKGLGKGKCVQRPLLWAKSCINTHHFIMLLFTHKYVYGFPMFHLFILVNVYWLSGL